MTAQKKSSRGCRLLGAESSVYFGKHAGRGITLKPYLADTCSSDFLEIRPGLFGQDEPLL